MTSFQQQIEQQNANAQREQLWAKPANDIISRIEANDSVIPERAIWELVQNAHDVSVEDGAEIEFVRNHDCFDFIHNGLPFEINNLHALNIQTSSKVRNSSQQIGQYGTGFLTTHKFGLKFKLSASLVYLVDDDGEKTEQYFNFTNLLFDRSPIDRPSMIANLERQNDKINEIHTLYEACRNAADHTVFRYLHEYDVERENVKKAFASAPDIAPYVISLIKRINTITFKDNVDDNRISLRLVGRKTIESGDDWQLEKVEIHKTISSEGQISEDDCIIYILHSKQKNDKGEPVVSIILPLSQTSDDTLTTFKFNDLIPRMFLKLPLIGSEHWGVNFIFNSPDFICENDTRCSVRFAGNGQSNDGLAEHNKEIISIGQQILFDFIDKTTLNIADKRHMAYIDFDVLNENEKLAEFYRGIKATWVDYFKCKSLFTTNKGTFGNINCSRLLSTSLQKACEENPTLLDSIYPFAEEIAGSSFHVPKKEDMLFWSAIVSRWMPDEPSSFFIHEEDIINDINEKPNHNLNGTDFNNIKVFVDYIIGYNAALLNETYVIPTVNGIGMPLSKTLRPIQLDNVVVDLLESFAPETYALLVGPLFCNLTAIKTYESKNAKETLSASISETLTKLISASKDEKLDRSANSLLKLKDASLESNMVECCLEYVSSFVKNDSDSFISNIVKELICFYEYEPHSSTTLDSIFDWRQVIRLLIHDALIKATIAIREKHTVDHIFLKRVATILFNYKDFLEILRYYPVYLDQNGSPKYYDEVKIEDEIPGELKDYYDSIVYRQTEGLSMIRSKLADNDYESILVDGAFLKGLALANEIEGKVCLDHYPNISESIYRNAIIEIVTKHCGNTDSGNIWQRLFPQLYNDKAILLLSIIESPSKKESLTKLMTIEDDEKLKQITDLSFDSHFEEIIQLGKEAFANRQKNEQDVAYKKMLGAFVEEWILNNLKDKIGSNKISCSPDIENEQGGQDLIIRINDVPVYYIEIKSRWNQRDSVMMSKLQMETSADHSDCYSLIAVDMSDYDREKAAQHIYPEIKETLSRIKVAPSIGIDNKKISDGIILDESSVHLGGDYKSVVPQKYLDTVNIGFDNLLKLIQEAIINKLPSDS